MLFSTAPTFEEALKMLLIYSPSSLAFAQKYAKSVGQPLGAQLKRPLRLAYYAYLLLLTVRLCLNSFFRGAYNQYDLSMFLLDRLVSHHLLGLALAPYNLLTVIFDYFLAVHPHRTVAPMLTDLLRSTGEKRKKLLLKK